MSTPNTNAVFKPGQDNVQVLGLDVHNPVFAISASIITLFVVATLYFGEDATTFFAWLRPAATNTFDWFLAASANIILLFCLFLIVSKHGSIRLGGKDARPDYGYPAWFAMLFAAGIGIGLMFYGVSEPMSHYGSSFAATAGSADSWAPLSGAPGDTEAAMRLGMAATIFHWGLHAWAIYGIVALALAFFAYNRKLPLTIRSAFHPILGDRVWGWSGHIIDTLAVFATLFGLATSLGLGAEQVSAGMNHVFGIEINITNKVIIIASITGLALISVVAGLDAGVKRLSEINMVMALLLLLFVIFAGQTNVVTDLFANLVAYGKELPALSNFIGRSDTNFYQGWTAFYWAWWVSWSPFVGMFIARISRGRTVRELLFYVLIVPTLVCALWMTAFGGTAISQLVTDGYQAVSEADLPLKLYLTLEQLPFGKITSMFAVALVVIFFVTSSDSGSLVIDTITAGGKVDAPVAQRVFWAILEGLVAIVLLIAGGLSALQAAAITTGLPFTLVLLLMCVSLYKGLASETKAA